MLEELKIYRNLGTPEYFFELANILVNQRSDLWTAPKIQKYFFNRVINGRSVFDGCIQLGVLINFIEVASDGSLAIPVNLHKYLGQIETLSEKFVEQLLLTASKDEKCFEIFSPQYLEYDLSNKSIKITNNAFGLKYSQFKQVLLDFNVLKPVITEVSSYYIISHNYMNLFQKDLMTEIKRRAISPEHLKQILELQNQYGEEAEKFVLEYEERRLAEKKEIVWVAKYSISEGYDIASFNTQDSPLYDRFIEVKSYSQTLAFYWTKNEIETAKIKGKNYFLYLVNRDEMSNANYFPMIINNPALEIFNNAKWKIEIDKYYVQLI